MKFYIPEQRDRPLVIKFNEYPCPVAHGNGESYRCKNAEWFVDGMTCGIRCKNRNDECKYLKKVFETEQECLEHENSKINISED